MSIGFVQTEDSIMAHLVAVMSPVPVVDTEFEDTYDPDPIADANFTPYVAVMWGAPIRNRGDAGIVSTRLDTKTAYVIVRAAAPDAGTSRFLASKVYDALEGFTPYASGSMQSEAGMAFSNGNATVKPTKFFREVYFTYQTNTIAEQ